jgi:hypothetical protein
MWTYEQAVEFGKRSAGIADDQQFSKDYESASECVWSYWQNVRDTLAENGASEHEVEALEAFWDALPIPLQQYRG